MRRLTGGTLEYILIDSLDHFGLLKPNSISGLPEKTLTPKAKQPIEVDSPLNSKAVSIGFFSSVLAATVEDLIKCIGLKPYLTCRRC